MDGSGEPESELTQEQLQDIVVAFHPATEAEALYLCNLLEDSGIPVITHGDRTGYDVMLSGGATGSKIFVPRVMYDRARILVADALEKVKNGRIDDVFEPENIVESLEDKKADPLLLEMARLRDQTELDRNKTLSTYIAEWQGNNIPSVEIARYLAAAGLKKEQADALLKAVVKERGAEIKAAGQTNIWLGILCIGAGFILFTINLLGLAVAGMLPGGLLIAFFIVGGFALILIGNNTTERTSLNDNEPGLKP